jgi:hypothetical protein
LRRPVRAPWRVVTDDVAVVGRGSAEGGGGGSRSGRRGSFGALPGGCGGSVLRWSVTSPWRAVAEFFERFCETSRRGRGGGRRWVARGSPSPPRRVVPCVSTAWAGDPSERSWRRVPRDCPRGLRKPPDESSRSLPWVSREAPQVVIEGHGRHPSRACDEHIRDAPASALERPAPGHVQGSPWGA